MTAARGAEGQETNLVCGRLRAVGVGALLEAAEPLRGERRLGWGTVGRDAWGSGVRGGAGKRGEGAGRRRVANSDYCEDGGGAPGAVPRRGKGQATSALVARWSWHLSDWRASRKRLRSADAPAFGDAREPDARAGARNAGSRASHARRRARRSSRSGRAPPGPSNPRCRLCLARRLFFPRASLRRSRDA